jgi:hypothetical protein
MASRHDSPVTARRSAVRRVFRRRGRRRRAPAGMQGFGGLSEVAFALWLLFGGDAKPRSSRGDSLGS